MWAAVARAQHHQYILGDVPAAVRLLKRCVLQCARARGGRGAGTGTGTGTGTGGGGRGGAGRPARGARTSTLEEDIQEGSDDGLAWDADEARKEEENEGEDEEEGGGQVGLVDRAEQASLHTALAYALLEAGDHGAAGGHFRRALRLDPTFAPASRGVAVSVC